jgi:hypothetical protein
MVLKNARWHKRVVGLLVVLAVVIAPASVIADEGDSPLHVSFTADDETVHHCDTVTFTNLTTGGTHPYTKAEWDFDVDGVFDLTLTGTEAEVMADVTHTYTRGGFYCPRWQMN